MLYKLFLIFILIISNIINSTGQAILREKLPFKTVSTISKENESQIDSTIYPDWRKIPNRLVENALANLDTSWRTYQIKELVKEWKLKNGITDDGLTDDYFGIIKDSTGAYSVKKMKGTVQYLYTEIGGGFMVERSVVVQDKDIRKILCLFEKGIILKEKPLKLQFIKSEGNTIDPILSYYPKEKLLEKNFQFRFVFNQSEYALSYTADLCRDGFEYRGLGTIRPIYFNLKLKLINLLSKKEQYIFESPHSGVENISEIIFGDVDDDSNPDFIYELSGECCIYRMAFLSGVKKYDQMFDYVGMMKVECIYP